MSGLDEHKDAFNNQIMTTAVIIGSALHFGGQCVIFDGSVDHVPKVIRDYDCVTVNYIIVVFNVYSFRSSFVRLVSRQIDMEYVITSCIAESSQLTAATNARTTKDNNYLTPSVLKDPSACLCYQ
jgi:hypothetical protein